MSEVGQEAWGKDGRGRETAEAAKQSSQCLMSREKNVKQEMAKKTTTTLLTLFLYVRGKTGNSCCCWMKTMYLSCTVAGLGSL